MISAAIHSSYVGLSRNTQLMSEAAARIADPEKNAGVKDIMDMKIAEHGVKANAAAFRIANETAGVLVDLIA